MPRRLSTGGPASGSGSGGRRDIRRAEALLLLAAAIWGFAFVAQKTGMAHVGPFAFNGIRFALGTLVLLPSLLREIARAPERSRLLLPGLVAGSILFAGASLQQVGIVYTTAGKAGFITGLYVLFVPLIGWAIGRPPGRWTAAGSLLAAAGLYLLTIERGLDIARGDLLVLGSAVCFAAHVLVIGRLAASGRHAPLALAAAQYAVCAILSLAAAAVFESTTLAGVRGAAWPILYGGLFSVGIAYTLQVAAQRKTPPAHAAILLSLEAVFAAIGGFLMLGERPGARALLGSALMLAGIVVSQRGAGRSAPGPRDEEGGR